MAANVVKGAAPPDRIAVRLALEAAGMRFSVRDELSMTLLPMIEEIGGSLSGLEKLRQCCEPLAGALLPAITFLSSSAATLEFINSVAGFPSSVAFFCCAAWVAAAGVAKWWYPCLAASGKLWKRACFCAMEEKSGGADAAPLNAKGIAKAWDDVSSTFTVGLCSGC